MEVEERLRFNHRDLVGIGGERVDVQFCFSRFEIDVAEGLQSIDLKLGEPDENAAVPAEPTPTATVSATPTPTPTPNKKKFRLFALPKQPAF